VDRLDQAGWGAFFKIEGKMVQQRWRKLAQVGESLHHQMEHVAVLPVQPGLNLLQLVGEFRSSHLCEKGVSNRIAGDGVIQEDPTQRTVGPQRGL
jgi:hypothetical protein